MTDTVDLTFLARLAEQNLAETRALREEVADIRGLALQTVEYARRVERRVFEMRDDFELMIRVELDGRLTHFETRFERQLAPLSERIAALEEG
jgi:hypothetical protein